MTTTLSEADEAMLLEQERIERLKGPSPFTPSETPEESAAWKARMAANRAKALQPTQYPPRPELTAEQRLEQRRQQLIMEKRAELLKGPIKRAT
jgi:hypothetical protein